MSIQLNQSERDYLEQLAQRRLKPTRRQKAIALLRLAEGDTVEKAAQLAGIHKDEAVALVAKFSERRLAGVGLEGTSEMLVALIRPDGGVRRYRLPVGGTLADLLSRSGASTVNQTVLVDNVVSTETSPLHEGAVVTIVPSPSNGAGSESRHAKIPSLQDDVIFQQYRDILTARRKTRAQEGDPAE